MQRNGSSHSRKTILVVEDEADAAELIRYNLEAAGFLVVVANDGAIALRRIFTAAPDLVILDLMLPEIDGFEVCKRLRTNPATKKIPIVILTGKTAELDRILALELGANDYVTKPFSPRELVLRVRNLLRWDDDRNAPEKFVVGDLQLIFRSTS